MLSKKLLGLFFVSFVTIHLTNEPPLINFLKISKLTSFLKKISVTSLIINGFLKSGLSHPYLSIVSLKEILGNFSNNIFLFENFLKVLINNFSTTINTSSCSTNDISISN